MINKTDRLFSAPYFCFFRRIFITLSLIVLLFTFVDTGLAKQKHKISDPARLTKKILSQFKQHRRIVLKDYEVNSEFIHAELDLYDKGPYPLTVNILSGVWQKPEKILYMVAPPGFNFKFNYFFDTENSIARFMIENNYLVIGITFRENNLISQNNEDFLLNWGMKKHRDDIRKVVALIKKFIKLPYDMLGQAGSAVSILDYAGKYSDNLDRIILLDTDSFDPAVQPEKVLYANMTYDALNIILDEGTYIDPFVIEFENLIWSAYQYPDLDSGQSREAVGLPGNFTLNGLLHFSLIFTTYLPGIHTPYTGLPGEWVMIKGIAAGDYNFASNPLEDTFSLDNITVETLANAAYLNGSGLSPIAFNRDVYAIQAMNGAYNINWHGIKEKVIMVNAEFSSGSQAYYGDLVRNAGNDDVTLTVIPGYAYLGLVFGNFADADVWPYFLGD